MKISLCLLTITLLCVSVATAEETFFSALESKAEVEKEGGTVDGGVFKPGKFGNGFVSEQVGDVIHFPVEDRFVNLDEGSVELWITMGTGYQRCQGRTFRIHDLQTRHRRDISAVQHGWDRTDAD